MMKSVLAVVCALAIVAAGGCQKKDGNASEPAKYAREIDGAPGPASYKPNPNLLQDQAQTEAKPTVRPPIVSPTTSAPASAPTTSAPTGTTAPTTPAPAPLTPPVTTAPAPLAPL